MFPWSCVNLPLQFCFRFLSLSQKKMSFPTFSCSLLTIRLSLLFFLRPKIRYEGDVFFCVARVAPFRESSPIPSSATVSSFCGCTLLYGATRNAFQCLFCPPTMWRTRSILILTECPRYVFFSDFQFHVMYPFFFRQFPACESSRLSLFLLFCLFWF